MDRKRPHAIVEVDIPMLPNFLPRVGGTDEGGIDVANVPDDQLRILGEAWTEALIQHARKRRGKTKEG